MDSCRIPSIATSIILRWWQTVAILKARDPGQQLGLLAVDQAANNTFEMAVPLALLNLYRDLIAPAGAKQKLSLPSFTLITKTIVADDCDASDGMHLAV